MKPEALIILVATFIAWGASHAFGIGLVMDGILLGVGVLTVGFSVFAGASELVDFVSGALDASTAADLDDAAKHFARAVVLLGVATIQASLLRRAVRTRGRPFRLQGRVPPPGRVQPSPTAPLCRVVPGGARTRSETSKSLRRNRLRNRP